MLERVSSVQFSVSGNCKADGTCECNAGFACVDCSCKTDEAPEGFANPFCCDVKNGQQCNMYTVSGVFDASIDYKCKVSNERRNLSQAKKFEYLLPPSAQKLYLSFTL